MRRSTLFLASVCLIVLSVAPGTARAGADGTSWNEEWPRFRLSEAIASGAALSVSAAVDCGLDPPDRANWRGPILIDRLARDAVAADSNRVADDVGLASDVMTGTLVAYPFVVDTALVLGGLHRSGEATLQAALIGVESFATTSLLTVAGKHLVARQRPPSENCAAEGDHNLYCSEERNESFPSGHTSLAFTGASYVCTLHEQFDLYGGRWTGPVTCWMAIGVAAGSGVSRMVSDNHYISDVTAGAAVGVFAGYLLPKILHFGWGPTGEGVGAMLVPGPRSLRLSVRF